MPSLKLSNPFRRGADRPSLKDRAASLKATAARVMRRKPAEPDDPFEGIPCPAGFVPYPFDKPMSFMNVRGVIHAEGVRLLDLAQAEYARRCNFFTDDVPEEERHARRQAHRASLRLDALEALVREQEAPSSAAQDAPARARQFIDGFDLSRMTMRDIEAIHDAAGLVGGVADALGCQPRSYTPNKEKWNAIGLFADAVSEACGAVQADAVREARKRAPGDDWEQGLRLKILARETIENGDQSAVMAFARDLQAMG